MILCRILSHKQCRMATLRHPNIIHYFYSERTTEELLIFMEFAKEGCLSDKVPAGGMRVQKAAPYIKPPPPTTKRIDFYAIYHDAFRPKTCPRYGCWETTINEMKAEYTEMKSKVVACKKQIDAVKSAHDQEALRGATNQ